MSKVTTSTTQRLTINEPLVESNGVDNMGASFCSPMIDISLHRGLSITIKVNNTNLAVGTITVKGSDIKSGSAADFDILMWHDGTTTVPVVVGTSFTELCLVTDIDCAYVLVEYARLGGNGQMEIWATRK